MAVCKLDQSQFYSSNNGKSFCGGVYSELLYLNSKFEAYSVTISTQKIMSTVAVIVLL